MIFKKISLIALIFISSNLLSNPATDSYLLNPDEISVLVEKKPEVKKTLFVRLKENLKMGALKSNLVKIKNCIKKYPKTTALITIALAFGIYKLATKNKINTEDLDEYNELDYLDQDDSDYSDEE